MLTRSRSKTLVILTVGVAASVVAAACSLNDGTVTLVGPSSDNGSADATFAGDGGGGGGGGAGLDDSGLLTGDADLDDSAVASDAMALPDATSTPDAGTCPAGQSLCPGTTTCVGNCSAQCPGAKLSCDHGGSATCVADCAACGGKQTTACYRCPVDQGFNVTGSCEDPASGSSCVKDQGYVHCGCAYDVANCPGDNQVCRPTIVLGLGVCKSCGEDNTSGKTCKANGKCDVGSKTCK